MLGCPEIDHPVSRQNSLIQTMHKQKETLSLSATSDGYRPQPPPLSHHPSCPYASSERRIPALLPPPDLLGSQELSEEVTTPIHAILQKKNPKGKLCYPPVHVPTKENVLHRNNSFREVKKCNLGFLRKIKLVSVTLQHTLKHTLSDPN
jgi:hypothetical protein